MSEWKPWWRRYSDPDETEGRALYRARADRLASAQINMAKRKVKIVAENEEGPTTFR